VPNRQILPIPRGLADNLDNELHDFPGDANLRYRVRRLVEAAYAEGYGDGHFRGYREENTDRRAAEQGRRPEKVSKVGEIQDQLVADLLSYLGAHCPVWEETFAAGPGQVLGLNDAAVVGAKFIGERDGRADG